MFQDILQEFFLDSDKYLVEYDESSRILDIISKKKTARRLPERVISFKTDGKILKFQTACYENAIVDDAFINEALEEDIASTPVDSHDEEENMFSQNSQMSIVTPVDDGSKKRQRHNSTPHGKALEASTSMSPAIANKVVDLFFKADLNHFVEETVPIVSPTSTLTLDKLDSEDAAPFVPILISIEGNIGAGKSFLLKRLRQDHPEWIFIDEPVDFWESLKNAEGESLLQNFYKDQRRWSYTFQNCALLSRFQNIENCVKKHREEYQNGHNPENRCKVFITERCLDTDHEVFAKMLKADGQLDQMEFTLYERWFGILQETATQLSAIVHVDTVPTLCSERIALRNRTGEAGIPLDYLCSLEKFQSAWIDTTHVPVTRTTSDDGNKVSKFVESFIQKIRSE